MSLSKLNYPSLEEEFCYWYHKVNNKFPNKDTRFSKINLIKKIHQLKRSNRIIQENAAPYQPTTIME